MLADHSIDVMLTAPDLGAVKRFYGDTVGLEVLIESRVESHAEAIEQVDHRGVVEEMQRLLPTDALLFLMELSIEPTLASLGEPVEHPET
jgi:hypothetical protein